ncbi:polysaccharide pyruvyl transferase family protein [Nocardia suismassiliense]|uniref:polysaccharide pyruvyl transferase family protein n=1 Tax=Nocardia suismassiliense TaxID=2077092 RepID=UPI001F427C23|nr:polysaccharide pyruvyl transferase family protein [Nocardia suismassiliense]
MSDFGTVCGTDQIRVLIENGEYALRNRGDIAMMAVTVRRLREHWPDARIGMLTDHPRVLRALLPDAEPICAESGGQWGRGESTRGAWAAGAAALRWRALTDPPKERLRRLRAAAQQAVPTHDDIPAADFDRPQVPAAVAAASLVIAQGGGYLTDIDLHQAHRTLTLLEHAVALGIPTAMIGQGIGPMRNPRLLERAAAVLPDVDVIALREGRRGPGLLADLGVSPERILVTGDDAVEFGHQLRRPDIGTDIGLSLRVADYSKISAQTQAVLGMVLRTCARQFDAPLAPLIISEYDSEDRRATQPLLVGAPHTRRAVGRSGTPHDVARQLARCRILVTSTYHLAVFALSQGIPAIGLSSSQYYDDKFHGLADMFGTGLRIVHLDAPELEQQLARAVQEQWTAAPNLRNPLQHRATEQIAAGRTALQRVFQLIDIGRCTDDLRHSR